MADEMASKALLEGPSNETIKSGACAPGLDGVKVGVKLFEAAFNNDVEQTTKRLQRSTENFW
jgi:hypothetical protein